MNLLDYILLAILAFYLVSGMYRGSITSFLSTIGFVAAWFGARQLYAQVAQMALSNQTLMAVLSQYLEPDHFFTTHAQAMTKVSEVVAGGEAAIQGALGSLSGTMSVVARAFEANVRSQMFANLGIDTLAEYLDQTVWEAAFNLGAFVLCFLAFYALSALVVNLLDHVISFPLLRGFDWLVGGVMGLVRGLVVCMLVVCLMPMVAQIVAPEFAETLQNESVLLNFIGDLDILNVSTMVKGLIGG